MPQFEHISLSKFKDNMRECTEKATYKGTCYLVEKYREPIGVFLPITEYKKLKAQALRVDDTQTK